MGSVKAVFCRNAVSFYWYSREQPRDICQTYQLTVGFGLAPPLPRGRPLTLVPDSSRLTKAAARPRRWTWASSPPTSTCTWTASTCPPSWRSSAQVGPAPPTRNPRPPLPGPDPASPAAVLGVVLKGSGQTSFSSQVRTVTFKDVPASYKPGIPFQGKVASPANVLRPSVCAELTRSSPLAGEDGGPGQQARLR